METRDYFEREIEKLGLALRKLFRLLNDLKQENKWPEATAAAQYKLEELFSIESADLLTQSLDQFKDRLDEYSRQVSPPASGTIRGSSTIGTLSSIVPKAGDDARQGRLDKHKSEYVRGLGNLLFEIADIERRKENSSGAYSIAEKAEAAFRFAEKKSSTVHFEAVEKLERIEDWRVSYL
jgi:hypothetical protein